jgi:hypothetical protein
MHKFNNLPLIANRRRSDPIMRKLTLSILALVLLTGINICGCAQENALGKAVASLFNDQHRVKQTSYTAWLTARDEGPRASLKRSSEHLQKAIVDMPVEKNNSILQQHREFLPPWKSV